MPAPLQHLASTLRGWQAATLRHLVPDSRYGKPQLDLLYGVFLLLLTFALKASILNLPYHWDELGAYIRPAHLLAQGKLWEVLPGFHGPYRFFGHPPLLYFSLALLFKLAGEHVWLTHLLPISASFLATYFTYLLGSRVFGRATGVLASLLLLFSPVYFAQSGMVHADIFLTALGAIAVYCTLTGRHVASVVCGVLLVLVKESGAGVAGALLGYVCLTEWKKPGFRALVVTYCAPLLVLAAFFVAQKATTGMFLPNRYFGPNPLLQPSLKGIYSVTVHQYRILVSAAILIALAVNRRAFHRKEMLLFGTIVTVFALVYSAILFVPRYVLPAFPYFFLVGAYALTVVLRSPWMRALAGIAVVGLFISIHSGSGSHRAAFDQDMQYVDVVLTHRDACEYIEANLDGRTVLALWPISAALRFPYLGYVAAPVKTAGLGDDYDVLVYAAQGAPENEQLKGQIVRDLLVPDRVFERNGKRVEVYLKP